MNFYSLPRELRDQIYELYFAKYYTVPPSRKEEFWAAVDDTELLSCPSKCTKPELSRSLNRTDAALLHASAIIREEASEMLFERSTFCFCINTYRSDTSSAPSRRAARKMRNVEISVDMWQYVHSRRKSLDLFPTIDHLCQNTLDDFAKPSDIRKSCQIIFRYVCGCTDLRTHTPLLYRELRIFKYFEKVVVKVSPNLDHMSELAHGQPLRIDRRYVDWWDRLSLDCMNNFDGQLGVSIRDRNGPNLRFEFHPRDWLHVLP